MVKRLGQHPGDPFPRDVVRGRAEAVHLGKGILERDIESVVPEKGTEVIMYCGGGYRSVLTAEVAQRMGYTNVHSLIGGYKALLAAEWQMENGD